MEGLGNMLVAGLIAMVLVFVIGIWAVTDYFFVEDTYESKKLIVPEMVIKSEIGAGVTKVDTIYIYHFK